MLIQDVWPTLTPIEQKLYMWQHGLLGGFEAALFEAICRGDASNRAALSLGFPLEVAVVNKWNHDREWVRSLRAKGLDV